MTRIRRAWTFTIAAARVLAARRSLVGVSVLAYGAALVVATAVFFAGLALVRPEAGGESAATWFVVLAAAIAGTWIAAVGQGAVVVGADAHMDGRDPDVPAAFAGIRGRLPALFGWAVIATVVTRLLDLLRRRSGAAGRAAAAGGDFAWSVATFLALPVIVFEDAGPVEGISRSSRLLKQTWGENVTLNLGLGVLGVVLTAPVVAGVAFAQAAGGLPLSVTGALLLVVYGTVAVGTYSALSAVLKTAVYRWAHDRPVDRAFDGAALEAAFSPADATPR